MIALLDTNKDLKIMEEELGCEVEQLLTPLTRFNRTDPKGRFAIDNGAFSCFDAKSFRALLKREWSSRHLCRFVAVPDVVGSAQRTLEVFKYWRDQLSGWPLALVAQDGQEHLPIPWEQIDAIFIGGTTSWKMSDEAAQICKAGRAVEKWVHVGRVNTPERLDHFTKIGIDSIDGSGIARYSWMREAMNPKERECPIEIPTSNERQLGLLIEDSMLNGEEKEDVSGVLLEPKLEDKCVESV